ncbi:MAG: divalent-cation tolerance protein CutA [Gemmatimonadota bacterium]|nr:divalent-cation tolerance protein CutA [Gemmatimonadota bacterium]
MNEHIVVTTTFPDEAGAVALADTAVGEGLAACAQVQGPIRSTFRWQGAVDHATEWYCHLKTTRERYAALEARILELHPYEMPEVIAVSIVAGSPAYLAWVGESVSG